MNETGATTAGLKLAQTFIMTTRGIPQVYYGDEIAMPGGGDPDNRRSMPGAFAGDPRDAFTAAGRTPPEQDVFDHLRRVIHLRHELEPLRRGALQHLYAAEQQYAFARTTGVESVLVAFNNDVKPATWTVDIGGTRIGDGMVLRDRLAAIGDVTVAEWADRADAPGPVGGNSGEVTGGSLSPGGSMQKPRLCFWQIWNMSFGFLGIQFGWGLQLANMSAIYENLGAEPDQIPLLWLAAPLTGLLVQPIVGR